MQMYKKTKKQKKNKGKQQNKETKKAYISVKKRKKENTYYDKIEKKLGFFRQKAEK